MNPARPGIALRAVFALALAAAVCALAAEPAPYRTSGRCDGLPRLVLRTPPGLCVGLAVSGFAFPRGVLPLDDGSVFVVDMGGWKRRHGSVWRLAPVAGGYTKRKVLRGIDRPHGIARGPDGKIYVGEVGRILRFDPAHPLASREDVIGGASPVAPLPASGRHPLVNFVFDRNGDLLVAVGSATDNCELGGGRRPDPRQPCAETEGDNPRGVIRRYAMNWPRGVVTGRRHVARGLRNSMALSVHPESGLLLQAENSRDHIHRRIPGMADDEESPHDELNVVEEGANFGWPYCYDNGLPSPEFPGAQCARFTRPVVLLPAHAAPLGMTWYFGDRLGPSMRGSLIVGYHGYRRHGHRVVAFPADARGVPVGPSFDVVAGWDMGTTGPMGAPVDIRAGADGRIYISEDRNGTVLVLSTEKPPGER